jgi:hypothetical protein
MSRDGPPDHPPNIGSKVARYSRTAQLASAPELLASHSTPGTALCLFVGIGRNQARVYCKSLATDQAFLQAAAFDHCFE